MSPENLHFSANQAIELLRLRVGEFVDQHLLPLESESDNFDQYENIDQNLLNKKRQLAREAGIWAPQVSTQRGGMGLSFTDQAILYEEANRSIFGPVTFHCAAPDDGNMRVLEKVGSEQQKNRWLEPIIKGEVQSAFAMTEPAPGGGSDPSMIQTTATLRGKEWVVEGRKWFITGAANAAHFILVARTNPDPQEKRRALTAFLFHKDQPGWEIVRRIGIMGPEEHGGHCELKFDGLRIPDENRLMEVGDGLKLTQIRLGPARLTHCMRWLGLSKRCMEIANDYVSQREGFGMRLSDRESVQLKLGQLAHSIQIGRLLVMHAAWKLDQGDFAKKEISMAKLHVADTLHQAADTAIQLCGARGYSKDTILEWIYRYARQARLVDGASEVHQMVLSAMYQDQGNNFWSWS
ncbi:MAG: acyl-CoA dehydrogenase family protein [Acidiferrobacterales bacterium]|nr:acyl-CoA dehydrogenase family protein [Acidiferrobacterales bacterium]